MSSDKPQAKQVSPKIERSRRTTSVLPEEHTRAVAVDSAEAQTDEPVKVARRRRAYSGQSFSGKFDRYLKYVPEGYLGRFVDPRLVEDRLERGWIFAKDEEGNRINYGANNGKDAESHQFIFMLKDKKFQAEDDADRAALYRQKLHQKGNLSGGDVQDESIGFSEQ